MHDSQVERWLAGVESDSRNVTARLHIHAFGLRSVKTARAMAERVRRLAASHPTLQVTVDRHRKPRWVEVTRRA